MPRLRDHFLSWIYWKMRKDVTIKARSLTATRKKLDSLKSQRESGKAFQLLWICFPRQLYPEALR